MATKVFMEALSPTMEEGRLVKWLKQEGDAVKSGDVLAEVETDKAVMELVARGEGVLRARLIAEGSTAAVGALVGVIAAVLTILLVRKAAENKAWLVTVICCLATLLAAGVRMYYALQIP